MHPYSFTLNLKLLGLNSLTKTSKSMFFKKLKFIKAI